MLGFCCIQTVEKFYFKAIVSSNNNTRTTYACDTFRRSKYRAAQMWHVAQVSGVTRESKEWYKRMVT